MTKIESQQRASDALIEQTLMNEATDLLMACLASIPAKRIDPKKYWPTAQKALRVGADRGATFERMVSEIHGQMMDSTTPFTAESSSKIYSIGEAIKSRREYQKFRQICRQNTPYIVLYARLRKEEMKKLNPYIGEKNED